MLVPLLTVMDLSGTSIAVARALDGAGLARGGRMLSSAGVARIVRKRSDRGGSLLQEWLSDMSRSSSVLATVGAVTMVFSLSIAVESLV